MAPGARARASRLHTRLSTFAGERVRERLTFSPDAGEIETGEANRVVVEATWFLSVEWPGPLVIGWKGCLERMCFGVDPGEEAFRSAEVSSPIDGTDPR